MRIALAGNPNSGKTTMFNALTGRSEKVGNWAGVTVDKKEHPIKKTYAKDAQLIAVDLPGAYSMSPFTSEESITSSYVKKENPDAIINIVDATNLSRSLFFTTQLLELGIPVVVALNKSDANEKKQNKIDVKALSEKLGCPVIETTSTTGEGLEDVIAAVTAHASSVQKAPYVQGDIKLTDKKSAEAADRKRFAFVNKIVASVETRKVFTKDRNIGDKIDEILTNRWLGIPIFALVMWAVFWISQAGPGAWLAEGYDLANGYHIWGLGDCIGWFKDIVAGWMEGANGILQAIILEGIIEGVAAVVGFLPLVMIMYFLIALLEDCGYMARATVVLDPIFKKVGLSGKSVIPFVIGTGCAIPGVMACRTIRNERERVATAMLAPFMPCGAKLPVIALFAGAFFDNAEWVGTLMYFAGIVIILLCALLINKLTGYKFRKSFFIIELPEYKVPSFWQAFKSMCQRGWAYIVKAGTVILVCNFVVYMMQTYGWNLREVEDPANSILATVATPIAYLIAPIVGVALWQLAAAAVTGFIAKECVVSTLATVFLFEDLINEELEAVGSITSANMGGISVAAGLAFLMFNLFTPPCFAAIGAMNAEIKSKKWLWAGIGLQLSVGYTVGFLVFFFGTLITGGSFGAAWMPILGWIIVLAIVAIFATIIIKKEQQLKKEYAHKA